MSAGPFLLLANPRAGRRRAAELLPIVLGALRAAGREATAELTTSIEHAGALAEQAARAGVVTVAIGGDGLLRGVAAGASRVAGSTGVLGLVPAGRGNDFARAVGLTSDVRACIEVLLTSEPRPTDLISVAWSAAGVLVGDVAIGNVYVGFDSLTNALANRMGVNLGGLSYKYAALHAAMSMPPLRLTLRIDGVDRHCTGSGVAIANGGFYGAGIPLARAADVHDGLLDVVTFEPTTRRGRAAAMLAMTRGRHLDRFDVRHETALQVQVGIDPAMEAYSDGDPMCPTPFTATVLPGAIGLLRP